jgi:hypothetical protein
MIRVLLVLLCLTGCAHLNEQKVKAKIKEMHHGLPNPLYLTRIHGLLFHGVGVIWCPATGVMIATVTLKRELTEIEAWKIIGSCVVPVLGGMAMESFITERRRTMKNDSNKDIKQHHRTPNRRLE